MAKDELSPEAAAEVLHAIANGETQQEIADRLGVSQGLVSKCRAGGRTIASTPTGKRMARLGFKGYASLLKFLQGSGVTQIEAGIALDVRPATMREILSRMHALGLIRITGWRQSKKGPALPLYSYSDGDSVPHPSGRKLRSGARPWNFRADLLAFSHLVRALEEGPTTLSDLQDITGLARATLTPLMRHFRSIGLARVADWLRTPTKVPSPMWAMGSNPDKPRPAPRPLREIYDEYNRMRRTRDRYTRMSRSLAACAA